MNSVQEWLTLPLVIKLPYIERDIYIKWLLQEIINTIRKWGLISLKL